MENSYEKVSRDSESTHVLSAGGAPVIEPGTILLDKFRVVELLGAGGMGNVYRVDHLLLDKQFAFKCLNKFQKADASWKRFQNEAKAAQLLEHPNLLKVFDFGLLENGQPFFLMELIEGKTLADEIKSLGHLPAQRAISLFIQVAFAIACAHYQKIVHRDLKPSNIMLVPPKGEYERESVKVVDFGIAKLTGIDDFNQQTLTKTGEIFGSPFYMSPEQCMGLPVDHRSDLYSLGCVFYETLTSAPPFMGETALSTMMKHLNDKPLSLKEASMGENFPAALEFIVEKLLEKDPEKRYQSAEILAGDLIALEREFNEQIEQGVSGDAVSDKANLRVKPLPAKQSESKKFGNAIKVVALVAFMYVVGAGSGYLYFKSTAPPPEVKEAYPRYWSEERGGLRIFNFPDFPIGQLIGGNNRSRPATGRISIRSSDEVGLMIDNEMDKDPSLLTRFHSDDLVVLDYSGRDGDASIFSAFKELTGLRCLNVSGTKFGDKELTILPHLKQLIYLNLCATNVTCTQLANYGEIFNLQFLDISHTNKPEDVLKLIPNFKNLQQLAVATSSVRDNHLKWVAENKTIRVLNVANNLITDEGVSYISNMRSLEWLDLSETSITPKCIKSLTKLKNLRILEFVPSAWSSQDVEDFSAELKRANPKIEIHYSNEGTYDPTVLLPFRWERIGLMSHSNVKRIVNEDIENRGDGK